MLGIIAGRHGGAIESEEDDGQGLFARGSAWLVGADPEHACTPVDRGVAGYTPPSMSPDAPRRVADSLVEMTEIVLPEDTNPRGTIFGGRVLALIDKCAAVVAIRHARTDAITASVDSVEFRSPVRLADVLVLRGRINATFGSSMEIEVEVIAEDPGTGVCSLTTRAFVTMVSVDERHLPARVTPLLLETDDERARAAGAAERRKARLARRNA
jgi:acyl-CoA hydrolase